MLLHYFTFTDMTLCHIVVVENGYNSSFKKAYTTPVSPTNAI